MSADPRDIVDLSLPIAPPDGGGLRESTGDGRGGSRPWLRLWFACSRQYVRAYRNPEGTGYLARCPACGKTMRFRVGEGGSAERFFEVSC